MGPAVCEGYGPIFLNGPLLCHIFGSILLNPRTMRVWFAGSVVYIKFDLCDPDPIILGLIFSFSCFSYFCRTTYCCSERNINLFLLYTISICFISYCQMSMIKSSKQERILPVWTLDNFIRS